MPGKIDAVGFLIKSMVERDPSKRRVKPSQQALQEFEGLQLEDSSDDSDYKIDEKEDDDDDDDLDSNFSGEDNEGDKEAEEESGSEEESSEEEAAEPDREATVTELLSTAAQNGPHRTGVPVKLIKVCCICLGDRNSDQNELVECDACHVVVHEGCNGISESHSGASSSSSDPTEPWFCDACRAGAARRDCDLCPNTGGLLKETDTGRWVHLVCALYAPGVAFSDVDRLTGVTLFEMPYTRWGAKSCSECEDPSLARTGVTIQCDAGMCKAAFHVTCAQQRGLLQEPRVEEHDQAADPYFAHCRLHTDKTLIRDRRKNFLAMRLYQRQQHPDKMHPDRLKRKLSRLQAKYRAQRDARKIKWTPSMKLPRPVTSSGYLLRALQRRAELTGGGQLELMAAPRTADVCRRWHLAPAFSGEFISYFLERGRRAAALGRSLRQLLAQQTTLQLQQDTLRAQHSQMEDSLSALRRSAEQLRADAVRLHQQLSAAAGERLRLPRLLLPPAAGRHPSGSRSARHSPAKPTAKGSRLTLHECAECGSSGDQHLLALCDTCHHHYHLSCLEPPLTRMPRKSRTAGWQCCRCAAAGSRAQTPQMTDTKAPRRLRRPQPTPAAPTPPVEWKLTEAIARTPAPAAATARGRRCSRKDVKHPGIGRGNWRRIQRQQQAAAAAAAAGTAATAADVKPEPTCQSVVMIEKLDASLVPHELSSPAPKRRRTESGARTPQPPSAGRPAGRPGRLRSIDDTIDQVLEQVSTDPAGGPPTPPPFVYAGRGRPPTLEPLKPYIRRPKRRSQEEESAAPVEQESAALVEQDSAARVEQESAAPVEQPSAPLGRHATTPPAQPRSLPVDRRKPPGQRRRRTKAEIDALNVFLEKKRAERRGRSVEEPDGAGTAASEPAPDVAAPASASSAANEAAGQPVSARRGARRGRPPLHSRPGRGRGRPPLQRALSAPARPRGRPRGRGRGRRNSVQLPEAALLTQLSLAVDAEAGEGAGPPAGEAGRPVRSRQTKAEAALYREQVLALKQARQRHQKLMRQQRGRGRSSSTAAGPGRPQAEALDQEHNRGHVVEVMTPMKIKIRPVLGSRQPSPAAAAASAAAAAQQLPTSAVCASCERADQLPRVSCDDCRRAFHLGCLVPPVTKTPKRPGYGWLCGHCGAPPADADADATPAADPTPAPAADLTPHQHPNSDSAATATPAPAADGSVPLSQHHPALPQHHPALPQHDPVL